MVVEHWVHNRENLSWNLDHEEVSLLERLALILTQMEVKAKQWCKGTDSPVVLHAKP